MKYVYSAIFHEAKEGGYWVEFPKVGSCLTQGETISEATRMAEDALAVILNYVENQGVTLPKTKLIQKTKCKNAFVKQIEVDTDLFRKNNPNGRGFFHEILRSPITDRILTVITLKSDPEIKEGLLKKISEVSGIKF